MLGLKIFRIILFLPLFLFSFLFAQDSLHTGLQIGGNLSSLTGGNLDKMEYFKNWGLNFGVYWNYSLNNFSDFVVEFRYINKGTRWGCWFLGACDADHIFYRANYLELPIYYSLKPFYAKNKTKFLNLQLGPFISYAVSTSVEESYQIPSGYDIPDYGKLLDKETNKFDYGISFSIQLFHDKLENVFMRLIYDLSLSSILKSGVATTPNDLSDRKMRSLILFLGYEF